jgi:pimeloyl-ACP methyl ester carboxylesterase
MQIHSASRCATEASRRRYGSGWLREPLHEMAERWNRVDGRRIRSLASGTLRDLPEVVILPGLGAPFYLGPWAEKIAAWTRVVILDLPGWRGGRAQSSPPTVEGVAAAASAWLAATDRKSVILVGHSSGAQSAIRTAHAVPERLRGVTVAGPTLAPEARRARALLGRVCQTLSHEVWAELGAVLPSYLRSGGVALGRLIRSVVRDRPEDALPGLHPPVLVVTGKHDRVAPPSWALQLANLADGRCRILPGAHNSCFTYPEQADRFLHEAATGWAGESASRSS